MNPNKTVGDAGQNPSVTPEKPANSIFPGFEMPRDAVNRDGMRAEINRLRGRDPFIRSFMDAARYQGLSGEDTYLCLAYYALRDRAKFGRMMFDFEMAKVRPPIINDAPAAQEGK